MLILSKNNPGGENEGVVFPTGTPDLSILSTLDFAALKDVRETGADYCHNFERLLHTTPGLKPGYLPQADSLKLLTGVCISCYEDFQIPK